MVKPRSWAKNGDGGIFLSEGCKELAPATAGSSGTRISLSIWNIVYDYRICHRHSDCKDKPAWPRLVGSGLIIRYPKITTFSAKRTYGLGRMALTHQLTKNIRSDGPPLAPIATASEKTNIFYS